MMGSFSKGLAVLAVATAGFTGGIAGVAQSADMMLPPPPPPPAKYHPPKVVDAGGGFYLRGYIGMTNQTADRFENVLIDSTFTFPHDPEFDSSPLFGGGIGYEYNDWLRFDVTGEYRGRATLHAFDTYTGGGGGSNEYDGAKSEWLLLANAYLDMGTWKGITPYVGAGIGAARNTIHDFVDTNTPNAGAAFAADESKWDFAWALHAGAEFEVTDRVSLDLGYRYVSLGDAITGDVIAFDGTNAVNNPMHVRDISSHDVLFGMRYKLGGHTSYLPDLPPPPVGVYKH
jgi:opacity protein-like surface antigen